MISGAGERYQSEWVLLQNQYDSYEKLSLLIKLVNIILAALLLLVWQAGLWAGAVVAILWLQDGIWKTYQSRINIRLLEVEAALASESSGAAAGPMQYNQRWLAVRPGVGGVDKRVSVQRIGANGGLSAWAIDRAGGTGWLSKCLLAPGTPAQGSTLVGSWADGRPGGCGCGCFPTGVYCTSSLSLKKPSNSAPLR
ncbi:MAG: hypothetical protein ACK5HY_11320 [Parahaliea sp.]